MDPTAVAPQAPPQLPPQEANYTPNAPEGSGNTCSRCAAFNAEDNSCVNVAGKISPNGTCDLWQQIGAAPSGAPPGLEEMLFGGGGA